MTRNNKQKVEMDSIEQSSPQQVSSIMQRIASCVPNFARRVSPPQLRPESASVTNRWGWRHSLHTQETANLDSNSPQVTPIIIPNLNNESIKVGRVHGPCPNDPNTLFFYPDYEAPDCCCDLSRGTSSATEGSVFRRAASILHICSRATRSCDISPCSNSNNGLQTIERPVTSVNARDYNSKILRMRFHHNITTIPSLPALSTIFPHTSPDRPLARRGSHELGHPSLPSGTFKDIRSSSNSSLSPSNSQPPRLYRPHLCAETVYAKKKDVKDHILAVAAGQHPELIEHQRRQYSRASTSSLPDGQDWNDTVYYPSASTSPTSSSRPKLPPIRSPTQSSPNSLSSLSPLSSPSPRTLSFRPSSALAGVPEGKASPKFTLNHLDIAFASHPLASQIYTDNLAPGAVERVRVISGVVYLDSEGRPVRANLDLNGNDFYHSRRRRNHGERLQRFIAGEASVKTEISYLPSDFESYGQTAEDEASGPHMRGGGIVCSFLYSSIAETEEEDDARVTRSRVNSFWYKAERTLLLCNTYDFDSSSDEDETYQTRTARGPRPRTQTANPKPSCPLPQLRGGCAWIKTKKKARKEKSRQLTEDDYVPTGLYWLAGGIGKPVIVRQWNDMKPEKRMGGFLGTTFFGRKAGTFYTKAGAMESKAEDEAILATKTAARTPAQNTRGADTGDAGDEAGVGGTPAGIDGESKTTGNS
ncbi:hypothetical protein B0J11DRAFT_501324 [Dendryphion nanum]|uniref:Uncharacterized protein n=1 Tax=Dendryphion nanum TaxID=256645 RepID=A0A9P9J0S6_9PLEO|nr:hypothetical protein B0J11DRAFT_501324 [Dendryphion nanum]